MYIMLNRKRYRITENPADPESFRCGLGAWLWREWEVVFDKLHPRALKLSPLDPEVPVFSGPFLRKSTFLSLLVQRTGLGSHGIVIIRLYDVELHA